MVQPIGADQKIRSASLILRQIAYLVAEIPVIDHCFHHSHHPLNTITERCIKQALPLELIQQTIRHCHCFFVFIQRMRFGRLRHHGAELPEAKAKEGCKLIIALLLELRQKAIDVICCHRESQHLTCGIQQLVALIHDEAAASGQDGPQIIVPVNHICQQQIVIADLEQVVLPARLLQKILVAAHLLITAAAGWYADLTAVKAAQSLCVIQI